MTGLPGLSAKTVQDLQRREAVRAVQRNMQNDDGTFNVPSLGSIGKVSPKDVPALADCDPGFIPSEYNVLIIGPTVREKVGNILIGDETRERLGDAMQMARIIRASPIAFNYDRFPEGAAPKVGDIIWHARFAGGMMTGRDGRDYRIIKDKDVMGMIEGDDNA